MKMMEMGMLEVVPVMVVPQLPATLGLVGLWVVVGGLVAMVVVWQCCGSGGNWGHGDVGVSEGDDEYGEGAGYRGTKDTKDPISSRCVSLFCALYLHNGPGE